MAAASWIGDDAWHRSKKRIGGAERNDQLTRATRAHTDEATGIITSEDRHRHIGSKTVFLGKVGAEATSDCAARLNSRKLVKQIGGRGSEQF